MADMLDDLINPLKPYFTALKLISLAVLAAGSFYAAWSWRGSRAETEQREAVDSAVLTKVNEVKDLVDKERTGRLEAEQRQDAALAALSERLDYLKADGARIKSAISADRRANPQFYNQPIPDVGRTQWLKARQAATSASSVSSPSFSFSTDAGTNPSQAQPSK